MATAYVPGTPFHAGERAVQARLGVREKVEAFSRRVIRPFMPDQHRDFYSSLPFIVTAARDKSERPWATILAGKPGFIGSPTPQQLTISATPAPGDALADALTPGADLGLLGIEFSTRRRNRVNGRVSEASSPNDGGTNSVVFSVGQSFGNCPQYITPRDWISAPADHKPTSKRHGNAIPEDLHKWITGADTFFIASGHKIASPGDDPLDAPFYGMDASHRGGAPGFVAVQGSRRLMFPDYSGNNSFNTLGNLFVDPRVGVTFVDFETGGMLQITGTAEIDWDSPAVATVPGAWRLVYVNVEAVVELRDALPIRWAGASAGLRTLRVAAKVPESQEVTSFYLEPTDGKPLVPYRPGQHLPIELTVVRGDKTSTERRTYSLSAASDTGAAAYRLSVKREPHGLVSRHLHDSVQVGHEIQARAPAGDFWLQQPGTRPVVLVSAGVGVTPMTAMLGTLSRADEKREVLFVHGARDGAHHALAHEVAALAAAAGPRVRAHVCYSRPRPGEDVQGRDYDEVGRVDAAALQRLLPSLDADYYLCGPLLFMAQLQDGLIAAGVAPEQIFQESFGPSGV